LNQGAHDKVLAVGLDLVRRFSNSKDLYNMLGASYLELNELALAGQHFQKAIEIDEKHAPSHFNLGLAQKRGNNFFAAIESFKKAVKIAPELVQAYSEIGYSLLKIGKGKEGRLLIRRSEGSIKIDLNEGLKFMGADL